VLSVIWGVPQDSGGDVMSSEKVDLYVSVHKSLRRLISQFLYQAEAAGL
jgi:hypothetical protein